WFPYIFWMALASGAVARADLVQPGLSSRLVTAGAASGILSAVSAEPVLFCPDNRGDDHAFSPAATEALPPWAGMDLMSARPLFSPIDGWGGGLVRLNLHVARPDQNVVYV